MTLHASDAPDINGQSAHNSPVHSVESTSEPHPRWVWPSSMEVHYKLNLMLKSMIFYYLRLTLVKHNPVRLLQGWVKFASLSGKTQSVFIALDVHCTQNSVGWKEK